MLTATGSSTCMRTDPGIAYPIESLLLSLARCNLPYPLECSAIAGEQFSLKQKKAAFKNTRTAFFFICRFLTWTVVSYQTPRDHPSRYCRFTN